MIRSEGGNECHRCGMQVEGEPETVCCQFCRVEFPSGRTKYSCDECGKDWAGGNRDYVSWDGTAVCDTCAAQKQIGQCILCKTAVTPATVRKLENKIICKQCHNNKETVWCPKCGSTFEHGGYLRIAFRGDRAGLHAACLVTHYRHDHVHSHDRAWQNSRYANKIPDYDYDDYKAQVNNRAKRQLIRSIAKYCKEGTYPADSPIGAAELVRAFGRLKENDEKTNELIEAVSIKLTMLAT